MVEPPVHEFHRSIALRPGRGIARERLNDVIPVYLVSEDHAALRQAYFGATPFWIDTRLRIAYGILSALVTLVAGLLIAFLMSERARRREQLAHGRAEEARRESEEARAETLGQSSRLQAVMNAASSGIVALNRTGLVALANPQARQMIGVAQLSGPVAWPEDAGFLESDTREPLSGDASPVQRAVSGERIEGEVFRLKLEDGSRILRLSSSPLPRDVSPEIGSVLVFDDISERERERVRAEQQNRLSAIGKLTGGVAHDFNNLLAVTMGNLELLWDGTEDAEQFRMIDSGLTATQRGADLTRNLLAFAREARLDPEDLDLNAVVLNAKNWMGRTLPESIVVETSLLAGLWPVRLDRASLESALLNLILNARDAMGGHGKLTIETANLRIDGAYLDSRDEELATGRYVVLAVSDTGSGIDRETLDRLFEPFFTTKEPGAGSGVGLSMVQGFAKQSGGTVQVYTEPGVGTTFKLCFPVSGSPTPKAADPLPAEQSGATGKRRILLAEDNDAVRDVLVTSLRGAGHIVVAARSGDGALELFRKEPAFDLVITDIVMPGELQGTDLARAIRALGSDLPVIFLSGYASEATVHGNGLRPEDIRLMKPEPKRDPLAAVTQALGERAARDCTSGAADRSSQPPAD